MGDLPTGLNSLGLVLDIAGVVLLFLFGLPPRVGRGGESHLLLEGVDEHELKRERRYNRLSLVGIVLVTLGFGLQLASNFVLPASS